MANPYDLIVIGGGPGGASLEYDTFAPYFDDAEALFDVHGVPLGPPAGTTYPFAPVKHEPQIADLAHRLEGIGLRPFHIPVGILLDQKQDGFAMRRSVCMRCSAFGDFPCLPSGKDIPLSVAAHHAATCRLGAGPATSVLNLDCRAHEIDNLYITNASSFPSISAVNPTLTIVANALRIAGIIKDRL